ncbi:S-ribosylhomocysteine lyase [Vulcanibacillus modesticaldus]|uniref:S-ribosylhomocysteine lyase n=1 Tax=Vulcanibacillus modesticaldus TaxID=337097 RepID=A0A1D2YU55_9BACI|nr:S-ribosylhomocysteine lyase [Vulcanibacillus modesticaldus]OEF99242.1 S-ribosylhomocysteine lyase [Vulcanibacillus modesticaldus]
MGKKLNVESFNLDHTKVKAPYIRLASIIKGEYGDTIYKYDIRFCQPNKDYIKMPALHALEHILAENIRNHLDKVVDLSPMGCQTGFYLIVLNNSDEDAIFTALEKTLEDVINAEKVPADNEVQCGNAKSHDLEGAKEAAKKMLEKKNEWKEVFA